MAHWLLKTEPTVYSWSDLVHDQATRWDGIANPVALKHLRAAKVGDHAIVYHTGDERAAVGIAEITRAAYSDPKDAKLAAVDLRAVEALARPVELGTLKADKVFAESPLVRQGRLSFVPLTDEQYRRILALASR